MQGLECQAEGRRLCPEDKEDPWKGLILARSLLDLGRGKAGGWETNEEASAEVQWGG